jgi:hypothetical protein
VAKILGRGDIGRAVFFGWRAMWSSHKGVDMIGIVLLLWLVASWITHIVVCLKTAAWGFLIAGALVFPIAVIHGTGIWFSWW